MHKCIASNLQFIVNRFMHTGITNTFDIDLHSDSKDEVDEHFTQGTSKDSVSAIGSENTYDRY